MSGLRESAGDEQNMSIHAGNRSAASSPHLWGAQVDAHEDDGCTDYERNMSRRRRLWEAEPAHRINKKRGKDREISEEQDSSPLVDLCATWWLSEAQVNVRFGGNN